MKHLRTTLSYDPVSDCVIVSREALRCGLFAPAVWVSLAGMLVRPGYVTTEARLAAIADWLDSEDVR